MGKGEQQGRRCTALHNEGPEDRVYDIAPGYGAGYRSHEQQDGVSRGWMEGRQVEPLESHHFFSRSNPGISETMKHQAGDKRLIHRQDRTRPNFGNPRTDSRDSSMVWH